MVLNFYYDFISQPCRAIWLFLKEAKIPFSDHPLDIMKGEHKTSKMRAINPSEKVPFIEDDGFKLGESVAIMRYLGVKYEVSESLVPRSDLKQVAKMDEFLNWHHTNLRKHCIDIFMPTLRSRVQVGKAIPKIPYDSKKIRDSKNELANSIKHIDEYFLAGKPFILGDELSIADISGVCELIQLTGVGEEACFEKVKGWVERVQKKLQPHFKDSMKTIAAIKQTYDKAPK